VWGDGQADSLQTVVDTPFGRVGALNCWEHFQPLLRYYEYVQGVQIHVASWPPMTPRSKDVSFDLPWNVTAEASYRATQFLAMEGQTFALCSTQIVSQKNHEVLGIKDKGFFNQVSQYGLATC
jgi:predicted amidohydrolase